MRRRTYLKTATALGLFGSMAGCSGGGDGGDPSGGDGGGTPTGDGGDTPSGNGGTTQGGGQTRSITYASSGIPAAWVHWSWIVADELGHFDENNIEVEFLGTGGGGSTTRAVTSGSADYGGNAVAAVAQSWSAGANVQMVGSNDANPGPMAICKHRDTDIGSVQEVAGHSFGFTSPSSTSETFGRYFISLSDGISESDVEWVSMGGWGEILAGLQEGIIDTGAQFEPMISGNDDIEVISWFDNFSVPSTTIITQADWAENNPDLVVDTLRSVISGCEAIINRPEESAGALAGLSDMAYSEEDILTTINAANGNGFVDNKAEIMDSIRSDILNFINHFGYLDNPEEAFGEIYNSEFIESAKN